MRQLHVAVAQINARAGELDGNLRRIERQVKSAAAVGVEVILFSETCLHAYDLSPENVALAQPLDGPLVGQLSAMAHEYGMAILAGFLERDGDQVYNSHAVTYPDGRVGVQRKHSLTETEKRGGLTPGPRERTVFLFNDVRCALVICADCSIPNLYDDLARQGVEYRFCPTAGGGTLFGKPIPYLPEATLDTPEARDTYTEYRQYVYLPQPILSEQDCPLTGFAAANAMGFDGRGITHMGHCMIVDNHRVVRAQIPGTNIAEHLQEQMVHAVVSFG